LLVYRPVLLFKSCQLIGNGTFGDFALNTQSCALFSAAVKKGFFMYIFIPGLLMLPVALLAVP